MTGHVAAQVLAIRRLVEDSPKERLSLRSLVKDLNRHSGLITRENYVCFDGLPYDYEAVRDERFIFNAVPRGGRIRAAASEGLHVMFDKLAGVHPTRRSREDRLPRDLFSTIGKWLDESGADELAKWASTYLAHAGGPNERTRLGDVEVTRNEIADAIWAIARTSEAISLCVYGGGRAGAVMPAAPFDQFERLEFDHGRERRTDSP